MGTRTALLISVLMVNAQAAAQEVVRGPYLQLATRESILIHWRTSTPTDSVVRYGIDSANLDMTAAVAGSRTEHSVPLSELAFHQQYFYSVGNSAGPLAGDASYRFTTSPEPGAPTRIWVIGDSGTGDANAAAVRDAFLAYSMGVPADLWLMLGDNAYESGTDAEYQAAVFDTYPGLLKQLPLWPTLGNHDGLSADSDMQTGPYYDIFTLPSNGEAGGLPSSTEAYYSFDYGDIHFICLDSYDTDRSVNGAMMTWLEADLALNSRTWLIAFWHHPPYSKGSHDSDTEGRLIDMRQNALPILESWGVDLVLAGHSHSYERSFLLDGHYGTSGTLDPLNEVLDPGDGRPGGDGAYQKPDVVSAANAGAVYSVAGSSGKTSAGSLDHPAMFFSIRKLGSLVLDISEDQLDGAFIDDNGLETDSFTITKVPDGVPPELQEAEAQGPGSVLVTFSERLDEATATNTAHYTVSGLTISAAALQPGGLSVLLSTSPMSNGSNYTLHVQSVEDLSGNAITPGSSIDFAYFAQFLAAFQEGVAPDVAYSGGFDAYIREASANTSLGLEAVLLVDGDDPTGSGSDMNILIGWDIGGVPQGAVVQSAQVWLETINQSTGPYRCFAMLRPWVEAEVTWNQALTGQSWGASGAEGVTDRGADELCAFVPSSTGPVGIPLNAAGIALVQSWLDGEAGNFGLIITNPDNINGADFHASESAAAGMRPRLELVYILPPAPMFFSNGFEP